MAEGPIIVQSDGTLLLDVHHDAYEEARDFLMTFSELEKSPEHFHTYRITQLSLWNAASLGYQAQALLAKLEALGRYEVPPTVGREIRETIAKYGRIKLLEEGGGLLLSFKDALLLRSLQVNRHISGLLGENRDECSVWIERENRGFVKQKLLSLGHPVEDLAGYDEGEALEVALRENLGNGDSFALRPYQVSAVEHFHQHGTPAGGSGVVVLPCGAGKTAVGIGVISKVKNHTLVLTPNTVAVRQWINEILRLTNLSKDDVGEYSGDRKAIRPVTVTTYQIVTHRKEKNGPFDHMDLFLRGEWGLIIYDEVHLLPAPVFSMTAMIQARRRLGLTATLVREDGREKEVFGLIGPKKYECPWRELEKQGWIAQARCVEVRVPLPQDIRSHYSQLGDREKLRLAQENQDKLEAVDQLLARHPDESILIIGQYLDQLDIVAARYNAPLLTGQMGNRKRQKLYQGFRDGDIKVLVVSKVANFAVDLPQASVAIQISGTFGSRQEEAQRLGRLLRPKPGGLMAHFYSVITQDSQEQTFALNRQKFLAEQGYRYEIVDVAALSQPPPTVLEEALT